MTRIDEFIAHGTLPFVGREAELGKIVAFQRSIPETQRLRAMLVTAEAGVGKSRLLEEALRMIGSERTVAVHVKLYPEAANSLAALLSRSIWRSSAGREILRSAPEEHLPDVSAALQRLARLRPTLLVMEDIHLFPPESIPDLMRLFESIADEPISLLCLSRPTTIAAQGVLELYLTESIRMGGIDQRGLAELWNALFGSEPPHGVIEQIHAVTGGNALAVRSGLRWAIQSGVISPAPTETAWRLSGTPAAFEGGLRRSVSLVAEGMVAHLRKEERRKAEILATLGEVFARETACRLDPEFGDLLADLTEQGILAETFHPVSPLCSTPLTEPGKGWDVEYPASKDPLLAFTHSLLHTHLAERAGTDIRGLTELVAEDAPLYSILPLRLLERIDIPENLEPRILIRATRRLSAIAVTLDRTASWKDAAGLMKPMYRLLDRLEASPDLEPDRKRLWRMNAQHISLSILRRSMESPEWIATHERQLSITESPRTLLEAQYRLLAHSYLLDRIGVDKTYEEGTAILDDLDNLLNQFVELQTDVSYVYILESLFYHAFANGDTEMMRQVQKRTARLLADPNLRQGARQTAICRVLSGLLKFYTTPEELRERENSIPLIEAYQEETTPFYGTAKIQFLGVSGRFAHALALVDPVLRRTREHGLWLNFFITESWRILCAAAMGTSLREIAEQTEELLKTTSGELEKTGLAEHLKGAFALAGFLSGTPDEELSGSLPFGPTQGETSPGIRIITALRKGSIQVFQEMGEKIQTGRFLFDANRLLTWKRLADLSPTAPDGSPGTISHQEIAAELARALDAPILQIYDVATVQGTMLFWNALTHAPMPDNLRQALLQKTVEALGWLHEREGRAYMNPLLLLLQELGEEERKKEWEERIENAPTEHIAPIPEIESNGKIRISMLGSIRLALSNQELAPIRGVRIRTLLGLMVADKIIETPLAPDEFLALAGGHESDPEHARKKKNMAVVRLREIIGHNAILTDGPTPQLNTRIVSVDLLEINALIGRALEAARRQAFVHALPLIEEILIRYGGEVPFPTLYEPFFEAARNDFEYRLRRAILETGRGMLEMGDAAGAEPLLRRAFEALPGDEEIADLLCAALEATGNRMEAERVRMRMQRL